MELQRLLVLCSWLLEELAEVAVRAEATQELEGLVVLVVEWQGLTMVMGEGAEELLVETEMTIVARGRAEALGAMALLSQ